MTLKVGAAGGFPLHQDGVKVEKPSFATTLFIAGVTGVGAMLLCRKLGLPEGVRVFSGTSVFVFVGGLYRYAFTTEKPVIKEKVEQGPLTRGAEPSGRRQVWQDKSALNLPEYQDEKIDNYSNPGSSSPRSVGSGDDSPVDEAGHLHSQPSVANAIDPGRSSLEEVPLYDAVSNEIEENAGGLVYEEVFEAYDPQMYEGGCQFQSDDSGLTNSVLEQLSSSTLESFAAERVAGGASQRAVGGVAFQKRDLLNKVYLLLAFKNPDFLDSFSRIVEHRDGINDTKLDAWLASFANRDSEVVMAIGDYRALMFANEDDRPLAGGVEEFKVFDRNIQAILAGKLKMRVDSVSDDGNCLFSSLEVTTGRDGGTLRAQVAKFLSDPANRQRVGAEIRRDFLDSGDKAGYPQNIKDSYKSFGNNYVESDQFLDDYVLAMGRSYTKEGGVWGGDLELTYILPNVIGKSIVVVSTQYPQMTCEFNPSGGATEEKVVILLWGWKRHYDPLVLIGDSDRADLMLGDDTPGK